MDVNVATIIFPLRAKLLQLGCWMKHSEVTTCVVAHRIGNCEKDVGKTWWQVSG